MADIHIKREHHLGLSGARKLAWRWAEQAEQEFAAVQAEVASGIGYQLCRCTWPPQIMTTVGGRYKFRCPKCNQEVDTTPHIGVVHTRSPRSKFDGF